MYHILQKSDFLTYKIDSEYCILKNLLSVFLVLPDNILRQVSVFNKNLPHCTVKKKHTTKHFGIQIAKVSYCSYSEC